mmetsp:Transcript_41730/g.90911  ORF Transcript_41730/g.90911 Transcript_41730/m.90911 type:complete len:240 (-) Transcript_41730:151-870(-)
MRAEVSQCLPQLRQSLSCSGLKPRHLGFLHGDLAHSHIVPILLVMRACLRIPLPGLGEEASLPASGAQQAIDPSPDQGPSVGFALRPELDHSVGQHAEVAVCVLQSPSAKLKLRQRHPHIKRVLPQLLCQGLCCASLLNSLSVVTRLQQRLSQGQTCVELVLLVGVVVGLLSQQLESCVGGARLVGCNLRLPVLRKRKLHLHRSLPLVVKHRGSESRSNRQDGLHVSCERCLNCVDSRV